MDPFAALIASARRQEAEDAAVRGISVEALRAEREAAAEAAAHAEQLARARAVADQEAAERALGERLGLGVRVRPALAMRLSGLSARSAGNGRSRTSVTHLQVLEPFVRGRLVRAAGTFLCRPGVWGYDVSAYAIDDPVTCPRCRTLAGLDDGPR